MFWKPTFQPNQLDRVYCLSFLENHFQIFPKINVNQIFWIRFSSTKTTHNFNRNCIFYLHKNIRFHLLDISCSIVLIYPYGHIDTLSWDINNIWQCLCLTSYRIITYLKANVLWKVFMISWGIFPSRQCFAYLHHLRVTYRTCKLIVLYEIKYANLSFLINIMKLINNYLSEKAHFLA